MNEREALLAALRDPAPPEAGWWPPAPGWWVIAVSFVLLAFALAARLLWRRRRDRLARERWSREALVVLARLRARVEAGESATVLAEVSILARRALLAIRPRREVAALHGERWLAVLDEAAGAGTVFTRGAGRLLESAPYRREITVERAEVSALLDAIERIVTRGATADTKTDAATLERPAGER